MGKGFVRPPLAGARSLDDVTDGARVSKTLRVLPLGGLGEIGKNMTVVEYDGRIVVVDVGLRFPTPEMVGIDLVLPDFTYLRERKDAIEAIVITHGHEDHLGALPWILRELGEDSVPVVYGGQLTIAMARSKLDEHKLRQTPLEVLPPGDVAEAGPFDIELVHMTHSIPDASGVALTTELGTILISGDYKFDQTPVDGKPADVSRLAELGRDGLLLLCGDSTNADRPGWAPSETIAGPRLLEVFSRCEGRIVVTSFASNIHRVQQVVDAAAALGRKVALVGRSMRKNVNIGRQLGHIDVPDGVLVQAREIGQFPDHKLVIISTGSRASRCRALRAWPNGTIPRWWSEGDTVVFSPPRSRQRAGGQRDDRPPVPDRLRRRHHRDAEIHASGHGYPGGDQADAQPDPAAVRHAVHGDFKRSCSTQPARRGGRRCPGPHLPRRERTSARD
jgi:ribonuclease J